MLDVRLRAQPPAKWIALGLILVALVTGGIGAVAWQKAWHEKTQQSIALTTRLLAKAITLRWGDAPTKEQLLLLEPQLLTTIRVTPGLLGLNLVTYHGDQAVLIAGAGQPLPNPPPAPLTKAGPMPETNSGGPWVVTAPLGSRDDPNPIYLWAFADPDYFRPPTTHYLFWGTLLLASFLLLVSGWWWLRSPRRALSWARNYADATLIAGSIALALAAAALTVAAQGHLHTIDTLSETSAPLERRIIDSIVQISRLGTEGLGASFKASDEVTADKFSLLVQHLTGLPGILAWFWLAHVPPQELTARVESVRQRDRTPDFSVTRLEEADLPHQATLLLEFIEPRQDYPSALGVLYDSQPTFHDFAVRAIARRHASSLFVAEELTSIFPQNLSVLQPVFRGDALLGLVGALVDPQIILNTVSGEAPVRIEWLEATPDGDLIPLAAYTPDEQPHPPSRNTLTFSRPFFAFGNTYILRIQPGPDFSPSGSTAAWVLLFGGAVLAGTSWWIAFTESRFRSQLEMAVEQRTADLRLAQARYDDLARRNRTFVWESDQNGLYQYVDPVVEDVLGYKPDELVGKMHLWSFHPEQGRDQLRHEVLRYLREKRPANNFENQVICKDGRVIWLASSGGPLLDAEGRCVGYRGWDVDITQEKEREILAARAQRLESLGILSGGIAHDLNNALGPLLMSADLLRMDETDPERLKLITTILDSARRGSEMVRQILLFARGSDGKKTVVDPKQLLAELQPLIRDTFPKNIAIETDIPAQPVPQILADPTQIHQVLLNLCINARDAMPNGGNLRLSLQTKRIPNEEDRAEVQLSVTDNGMGMSPEIIAKVFDPFFTTKEVGRGTGLGLSTSHTIIRAHGGRILVESTIGVGTRFTVVLPALTPPVVSLPPPENSGELVGKGEKILVINDDEAFQRAICSTLTRAGFLCHHVAEMAEVVALFQSPSCEFRLVLVEYLPPAEAKLAIIRALKTIEPRLPIIVAAPQITHEDVARTLGNLIHGLIAKPYRTQDLLTLVRTTLDRTSSYLQVD